MTRKRRTFSPEYKQEAVRLVLEEGRSLSRVARDLGVQIAQLRRWQHEGQAAATMRQAQAQEGLDQEVRRLRRENATLRQEQAFLKKAAAYFARTSPRSTP
jgi:transposase